MHIVDANDSIFINDEIYLSTGKSLIQRAVQEICAAISDIDKAVEAMGGERQNVFVGHAEQNRMSWGSSIGYVSRRRTC